jgi:hypothetical protein
MMVMKYFRPKIHLSQELEFDIWREASLVESYGTSKEGLAVAAARRGFNVYTIGKPRRHSFVDKIADKVPNLDYELLELLYRDTKKKFRSLRLKNVNSYTNLQVVSETLARSYVPIVLTSTSVFGKKEGLPHWVVVTGHEDEDWYVNNPLAKRPNSRIRTSEIEG